MRKLAIILLGLLLLPLFLARPAEAATKVELSFQLNQGNGLYYQTWNSLEVTLVNSGDSDIQGSVEVRWAGVYRQEIFIEKGKTITLRFYLPPAEIVNSFFNQTGDIEILVREKGGRNLARDSFGTPGMRKEYLVGILSPNITAFQRLTALEPSIQLARLKAEDFDNFLFMDNYRIIVLSEPETLQLKPAQMENLATWVKRGGLLVMGGGSRYRQNQAAVPVDILPVEGTGTVIISDLTIVGGAFQFASTQGRDFLLTIGALKGEVLLTTDQYPLLVGKDSGRGRVLWSALDLEGAPLDNALNFEAFWGMVLRQPAGAQPPLETWRSNNLFNIVLAGGVGTGAISPLKAFLGLILYIALLGPANFLILKKYKRWEWSWFTIPTMAIIFTAVVFATGSLGRSTEMTAYQFNIIELDGNQAIATSFTGLFIPQRGNRTLEAASGNVAVASGNIREGNEVLLVSPPVWSVQKLFAMDRISLPGGVDIAVTIDGKKVEAVVTNRTGIDIFDSFLRFGTNDYLLGPLAPGATLKVDLTNSKSYFDLSTVLSRYNSQGNHWFGSDVLPTYDAVLVFYGFSDTPDVLGLSGTDGYQALNLLVATGSMDSIGIISEDVNIESGWLIPRFSANVTNVHKPYYSGGEMIVEGSGYLEMTFNLPRNLDLSQGIYTLNLNHFWGEVVSGVLSVWNPVSNNWQKLADIGDLRGKMSYTLSNIEEFAGEGRVLVRLSFEDYSHIGLSSRSVDITLEGGKTK